MSLILGYVATLLVTFFTYNIFVIGLNIQFGYAGILNFTVITFMAFGAYFYAVFVMPHADNSSQIFYILGLHWPWPLAMLAGIVASGALGYLIGLIALKRLRSDYLAIVTLATGTLVYGLFGNNNKLFDGWSGLFNVNQPFQSVATNHPNQFSWIFVVFSGLIMVVVWLFANRLYASPLGRSMRAIREDQDVVDSFGKNSFKFRMMAMVIGSLIVGIGGVLTIQYIGALSPAGWTTGETFVVWAALLVGGRANNLGAILGSLLVAVVFNEATRYIPQVPSHPNLIPNLRNMIIGSLVILSIWFRPQGVFPERKASFLEVPLVDKYAQGFPGDEPDSALSPAASEA
ncbi:MAG: branched-chain amino acid ABC transporter permease [Actinomycetota bacterium]|nr:branched-chain amino acid ABC transporter permease [Actinomycetota bacterium]MDA8396951.1 branched-chain amino acid ABC transporter permease [Actinomycetota bacterium]